MGIYSSYRLMERQSPAYQIPYHNLDVPINPPPLNPEEYSSLHTLYPGQPMRRNDYDYMDRYYIPHAHPCAARASFVERREDTIKAARLVENIARKSAGGPDEKVTIHAVADPSQIIEQPSLEQLSTQAPVALNDGMSFPMGSKVVVTGQPEVSPKMITGGIKENFVPITFAPKENGEMICVLIFIGCLILIFLLAGAFVGTTRARARFSSE